MHALLIRAAIPASAVVIALGVVASVLRITPISSFDPQTVALLLLIVPFALYARLWSALMIGLRRIASSVGAQIAFSFALLVLDFVFLVLLSGGVRAAVIAYLVASVGQVIFMLRRAPRSQSPARRYPIRPMLLFGARSYPLTLASLAWSALPSFLLAHFAGPAAVGILSVAQQLAERAQLPVFALQDTAFQRMSSADRTDATDTVRRYTRVAGGVMVVISVALILLAPLLVPFLFGAQYAGATLALQVLLLPVPLVSVAVLLTPFLLGQFRDPTVVSIVVWGQIAILVTGVALFSTRLDAVVMAAILSVAQAVAAAATLAVFVVRVRAHPASVLLPSAADARFAIAAVRNAYRLRRGDGE
jgi:O-antigen/teichoic acid export membrane protein